MITEETRKKVERFVAETNLADCYRQYDWKNDHWSDGFRDIYQLEMALSPAAKNQRITKDHIIRIAQWGGYPSIGRIHCYKDPLVIPLYDGNEISAAMKNDPVMAVRIVKQQTTGIGPTYISKVLRFAAPAQFGAIDSRLVRVFGLGDPKSRNIQILNLNAIRADSGRWFIGPENWPGEYGTWTAILYHLAGFMNTSNIICPHPDRFVQSGLRQHGVWLPADVEMALFSFASRAIFFE